MRTRVLNFLVVSHNPVLRESCSGRDNHSMRLRLGQQIGIGCCLAVSGFVAGWWLRSSRLNDDYQVYAPMYRPKSVPRYALWVGGADGGAYVHCTLDLTHNANPCTVWNDSTGLVVESGNYRLEKEGRAASEAELQPSFPDFGGRIYLENGLILKRQ